MEMMTTSSGAIEWKLMTLMNRLTILHWVHRRLLAAQSQARADRRGAGGRQSEALAPKRPLPALLRVHRRPQVVKLHRLKVLVNTGLPHP
jgi:hypothetical protein